MENLQKGVMLQSRREKFAALGFVAPTTTSSTINAPTRKAIAKKRFIPFDVNNMDAQVMLTPKAPPVIRNVYNKPKNSFIEDEEGAWE